MISYQNLGVICAGLLLVETEGFVSYFRELKLVQYLIVTAEIFTGSIQIMKVSLSMDHQLLILLVLLESEL